MKRKKRRVYTMFKIFGTKGNQEKPMSRWPVAGPSEYCVEFCSLKILEGGNKSILYDDIFVDNRREVDNPVISPSKMQFTYFPLSLYVSSVSRVTYLVFKIHAGANRTKLIHVSRIAYLETYVTSLQYAWPVTMATQ